MSLTAAVSVSPRLAGILAPEWRQVELDRGSWRETLDHPLDLILLECRGDRVEGWADLEVLGSMVDAAAAASIPVAVWATDGTAPRGSWVSQVTAVGVTTGAEDNDADADANAATRDPHYWLPAAQPRLAGLAREDATTTRRGGLLSMVDGLDRLTDDAALRLVADAVGPMPATSTPLIRLAGKSAAVTLPAGLTQLQIANAPFETVAGSLGDASAVLDLSATSAQAPWTTLAAAMAQTPLVGTAALTDLPDDLASLVTHASDPKALRSEAVARINQPELVAREGLRAHRAAMGHTAAHRVRQIAQAVGLEAAPLAPASISAVVPTNRTHELDNVFANLARQSHPSLELVLVLHGLETDDADLRRRALEAGVDDLTIVHADAELTLGACMNLGVDAAGGRYIAKMDDDNHYGANYLSDLLGYFATTDAGIVGKWAHYVWLRSSGAVVLRYPDSENRYERRIQGGSMLFAGDVAREIRFSDIPRAVDSDILDRSAEQGVRVYSGDRYNYVSIRGDDRLSHTWTVGDSTFLTATGRLLFYGDPTEHVAV